MKYLITILLLCAPLSAGVEQEIVIYFRGDANGDGAINISDPITITNYLYEGGPALGCPDAADANNSGVIDLADVTFLMSYLFEGGSAPSPFETECME